MPKKSIEQVEVLKGYLAKYPYAPTLTIAKAIMAHHPALFMTTESIRGKLRYYRGQQGVRNRDSLADKQFISSPGDCSPFSTIPEGLKHFAQWAPTLLPGTKTLILGDIHSPYHDKMALTAALEYGYAQNIDSVLLLGDVVDFHGLSKWNTDPRKRDLWLEIETTRAILQSIRDGFPKATIFAKQGNHEERYERFLWVKAPELLNVPDFDYGRFMQFERNNIQAIADRNLMQIGGLYVIHGHEFGPMFGDPVNPARGIYNRGKAHCLCAHWHRTSHHSETSMSGKTVGCWSLGCLCDLHPEYRPVNKWNHGFAIVENLGDNDEFLVHNHVIDKGKVY